jgi:large subunit ribosomal protein L27e
MDKKKISKISKIKSFVNIYNYSHFIPTRYFVVIPLDKTLVNKVFLRNSVLKHNATGEDKVKFEE